MASTTCWRGPPVRPEGGDASPREVLLADTKTLVLVQMALGGEWMLAQGTCGQGERRWEGNERILTYPIRVKRCVDHFLYGRLVEVWLVIPLRKIDVAVREAKHVPWDRAQLAHLVDVEAGVQVEDCLENIIKRRTLVPDRAIRMGAGCSRERPLGRELQPVVQKVVVAARRTHVVDECGERVVERHQLLVVVGERNGWDILSDVVAADARIVHEDAINIKVSRVISVEHAGCDVRDVHASVGLAGDVHLAVLQAEGGHEVFQKPINCCATSASDVAFGVPRP